MRRPLPTRPEIERQIANVIQGLEPDGIRQISRPFSFTKSGSAQGATVILYQNLCCLLYRQLAPEDYPILLIKLMRHLVKIGAQTAQNIAEWTPTLTYQIARPLRMNPTLIQSRQTLAAIIREHEHMMERSQALNAKTFRLTHTRPVLWENEGYRLAELTRPEHLLEESHVLKHCVGLQIEHGAPENTHTRSPSDPKRWEQLHYWQRIQHGHARLFSFMYRQVPLVTIHYTPQRLVIDDIRIKHNQAAVRLLPAQFRILSAAFDVIRARFGLLSIVPFDQCRPGIILTRSGEETPATTANLADALTGTICLTSRSEPAFITEALANPYLTLNVSDLTNHQLANIIRVAGRLTAMRSTLLMPKLVSVGGSNSVQANVISQPKLTHVGGHNSVKARNLIDQSSLTKALSNRASAPSVLQPPEMLARNHDLFPPRPSTMTVH